MPISNIRPNGSVIDVVFDNGGIESFDARVDLAALPDDDRAAVERALAVLEQAATAQLASRLDTVIANKQAEIARLDTVIAAKTASAAVNGPVGAETLP